MNAKLRILIRSAVTWMLVCLLFETAPSPVHGAASQGFLILVTSTSTSTSLTSKGQSVLWRSTPDGKATRLLARAGAGTLSDPALAPDGKHVAYMVDHRSLWQMNADGTQPRQLLAVPSGSSGQLINPRYAPDGRSIAVTMGCCGKFVVYDVAVDGKQTSRLLGGAGTHIFLDWTRSGTRALYTANGTLWTADLSGRKAQALGGDAPAAGSFLTAQYSPDGTHMVTTLVPAAGEEAAGNAIVLLHADGQYLTFLTRDLPYDVSVPSWSPDGKSIAFSVGSGTEGATGRQHDLWIMRYDGSHKQNITRGKLGSVVEVAWSR